MLLTGLAVVTLLACTTLDFARDILGRLPTATPTAVLSATPPPPEISINFNADRYTIEQGECTTLRWAVTGADRIDLLDQEREATEAQRVCPNQTTGFTQRVENNSEQDSAFLQIEVTEPQDNGLQQGCLVYDAQTQQDVCQVPCQQPNPEQYPVCHQ